MIHAVQYGPHLLILPVEDCPLLTIPWPELRLSGAWSGPIVTIVQAFSVLIWVLSLCYVRERGLGRGGLPAEVLISNVIKS